MMRYTQLCRLCQSSLVMTLVFLVGCSSLVQTVPIAVIYDRDLDEFYVEVVEVPKGETPAYPDTLGFITLIDGQRHEGLVPPAKYRKPDERGDIPLWAAPYKIYRKSEENIKWYVERGELVVSRKRDIEIPLVLSVRMDNNDSSPFPTYFVRIKNVQLIID